MTLEQAIKHCNDVAKTCNNVGCSINHLQLANWLKELLEYKHKYGEL